MAASNDGPPERDVKDFRFQQLVKIRVSKPLEEVKTERTQWLASASSFGLVFIVVNDGWKVYKVSDICRVDSENARERSTHIVENLDPWSTCSLTSPVSHIALSCDELTLAVVIKECGNLRLYMYDVRQFVLKTDNPPTFARSRVNASPGTSVQEVAWNPTDPSLLAVCVSDGSVEMLKVTDSVQTVGSLPVSSNATSVCWSPKGRQLVVGHKNGTLTQYDQEMTEKRKWPSPPVLINAHQVVDVLWISTYVFIVAYLPKTATTSDQPHVVLTISSKEGRTSHINFEDVCYGSGEERKHKYYFAHLPKWDLVLLSSSNATETAIIGKHFDETATGGLWEHWTLEDSGRAELPLTDNTEDSFPMGATVSLSSQTLVPLGDNKSHPPSPLLLLLSTDGLLVPYHIVYMHAQATSLTVQQEVLSTTNIRSPKGEAVTVSSDTSVPTLVPPNTNQGSTLLSSNTNQGSTLLPPNTNQGSTLPTTGSSFQFVTRSTQSSSDTPGASLFSQPRTSTLPTSGSSFQFVAKPAQSSSISTAGQNVFAPVGSQASNIPSSGSQRSASSFSFTSSD